MKIQTEKRNGLLFSFINKDEFERIYNDSFIEKEYFFETTSKTPFILDCGSHIGVSVLFFKQLYPSAKIIAFEPNPTNFKLLQQNVKQNGFSKDVTLINAAVFKKKGTIHFYTSMDKNPWTWGDSVIENMWNKPEATVMVQSVALSTFITKKVDFLKVDIEGAEQVVLQESEKKLEKVDQLVFEYHRSSNNKNNNLEKIFHTLQQAGFTLEFNKAEYWLVKLHVKKVLLVYARKSS